MLGRDSVIAVYEQLLGRLPESEETIEAHCHEHADVDLLAASIKASEEYKNANAPKQHAASAPLTRAQLASIYREVLRRPPESEEAIALHLSAQHSPESFRASLERSEESRRIQTFSTKRKISFEAIDAEVAVLEYLQRENQALYSERLNDFWLDIKPIDADPRSEEYRDWVMAMYSEVSQRSYGSGNEITAYDVEECAISPVPYSSGDAKVIGDQVMAVGHVIRSMNLPPGANVLEMGFGWGNTTVQLAMSGYAVKGIDISPNFVAIASRRVKMLGLEADLSVGRFFDVEAFSERFDAVLFFECFHHCDDHVRLLKAVARVLKPGGRLVLSGETINNALPYPWGINPDGQAIYCIRQFGWLELSFREEYLLDLLDDLGWNVEKHDFINAAGITYVATRKGE